ncbi:MAG: hypothetical protein KKD05_05995 [Candidatus Omnitrophica bacterium]|nr:hypothetical protein [Candidatus Omnitrophota bacterium]
MYKKNKNPKFKTLILISSLAMLFFMSFVPKSVFCQEQYQQVPALIHISSNISDGRYEPEQIIDIAVKAGFKIIVFTEREVMRWEYGVWPLRRIIKKVIKNNSLETYGIKKYLKKINDLQAKNPNILLVSGIESTPFYYWSGSIFKHDFTLHNAHKHLLILGLNTVKDIKKMPIIANPRTLVKAFKLLDLLKLWPGFLLVLGLILVLANRQKIFRNSLEKQESQQRKIFGIIICVISSLFLINNFPFKEALFDQYHGDKGVLPYQNMIDYVNRKNGLVFWAHPEAENISQTEYVKISTKEHARDFYATKDYTGFNVFYDGYNNIGRPEKLWDNVLLEYVQGQRSKPVWAIGGLAFDFSGDLKQALKDLRNIVLLDSFSKESFIQALDSGKVYVVRGPRSESFVLENFSVNDPLSGQSRIMGQSLKPISSQVMIKIKGEFKVDAADNLLSIHLIKNGKILKTFKNKGSFAIEYLDAMSDLETKGFYRIEIRSHGLHVIANPIFLK